MREAVESGGPSVHRWRRLAGVRAVLFDLGGTVLSIDHPRVTRALTEVGYPPRDGWIGRAERAGRQETDRLVRDGTRPEAVWRGFWSAYLSSWLAPAGAPDAALEVVYRQLVEFHRRHHLWNRPVPGAPAAIASLGGAGLRVAAISNSDGRAEQVLAGMGLAREFEFVIDSAEIGIEKPDARIFRLACERLGLDPGECSYVGDVMSVDIEGAAAAGLLPVLLDHYGSYAPEDVPAGVPRVVEASDLVAGFATARLAEGGNGR